MTTLLAPDPIGEFLGSDPSASDTAVDDLLGTTPSLVSSGVNTSSNEMAAAFITDLGIQANPEAHPVDMFNDIVSKLEVGAAAIDDFPEVALAKANELQADRAALVSILEDASIEDAIKKTLGNIISEGELEFTSFRDVVSTRAAAREIEDNTADKEGMRIEGEKMLFESLKLVDKRNRIYNREIALLSPTVLKTLGEFAEIMIPFVEQTGLAKVRAGLKKLAGVGEDSDKMGAVLAFALMGSSRESLGRLFNGLSLKERSRLTELAVSLTKDRSSLGILDENTFFLANNLAAVLGQRGGSSFGQEVMENVISLMDALFLGTGVVKAALKGAKVAKFNRAQKLNDRVEAFISAVIATNPTQDVATTVAKGKTKIRVNMSAAFDLLNTSNLTGLLAQSQRNRIRSTVKPGSLGKTYQIVNEDLSRAAYQAAVTDDGARALFGTTVEGAQADGVLPQILDREFGAFDSIPNDMDVLRLMNAPEDIAETLVEYLKQPQGRGDLYPAEKANFRAQRVTNIKGAFDQKVQVQLMQIGSMDDGIRIRVVLGEAASDPQQLLDVATIAGRSVGIERSELILLSRDAEGFKVVPSNTTKKGDYMVAFDDIHKFDEATGEVAMVADTVVNNFFDRMLKFSPTRFIFDPASLFEPLVSLAAASASDRAAGLTATLTQIAKDFTRGRRALSRDQKVLLDTEIRRANRDVKNYSDLELKGQGLTNDTIASLKEWRKIWDTLYVLENQDAVLSLRARGFSQYVDQTNNTNFFVREVKEGSLPAEGMSVYITSTGEVRKLSKAELDKHYATGGKVGALKDPFVLEGEVVEFVLSTEKASDGFRPIKNGTRVLNKLEGYYAVKYGKGSKFIERRLLRPDGRPLLDSGGKALTSVVGVARDTKDAKTLVRQLEANEREGVFADYTIRGDRGGDITEKLQLGTGRSAQMRRGKPLATVNSRSLDPEQSLILTPEEALANTIRSLADRVSMRNVITSMKRRFVSNFGDLLPKDKFNNPMLPETKADIGLVGQANSSRVADARTTFDYIKFLDRGHADALDMLTKGLLNSVADLVGDMRGFRILERPLRRLSETSLNSAARRLSFNLYLALNPMRQLIVQSHQASRLLTVNPAFMADPTGMAAQMAIITAGKLTGGKIPSYIAALAGMTTKEANALFKEAQRSGLMDSVFRTNLISDSRSLISDMSASKLNPIRLASNVGFGIGEFTNIMTAWLAFRDKAIRRASRAVKKGDKVRGEVFPDTSTNLTGVATQEAATPGILRTRAGSLGPEANEVVAGLARNFTYNQNPAGQLGFNIGAARALTQFMQITMKALLANTFNRAVNPALKARTIAFDTVAFGTPFTTAEIIIDQLEIENETVKTLLRDGAVDVIYNGLLTGLYGSKVSLDFTSLDPTRADLRVITTLFLDNGGMWEAFTKSPVGAIISGRFANMITDVSKFFGIIPDPDRSVKDAMDAILSIAKISSGVSNGFYALYAMKKGAEIDSKGFEQTRGVNVIEAMANAFGFRTKQFRRIMETRIDIYLKSTQAVKDAINVEEQRIRALVQAGKTKKEILALAAGTNDVSLVWENAPAAISRARASVYLRFIRGGEEGMRLALNKVLGVLNIDEFEALVNTSGATGKDLETYRGVIETIRQLHKDNADGLND